jgi:hypothetical protein
MWPIRRAKAGADVLLGAESSITIEPAWVSSVEAARELGVPDERVTSIAAQVDGITPANGASAASVAIEEIARQVAACYCDPLSADPDLRRACSQVTDHPVRRGVEAEPWLPGSQSERRFMIAYGGHVR